jgi:hypothetical protein
MRHWILLIIVLLACLAWTQGPDTPRLGWLRDVGGGLRPLSGVAGNFVPGEVRLDGVVAAASSGDWTLAKTGRSLVVLDRSGNKAALVETQDGGAVFGFSPGGGPAAVYLPDEHRLLLWNDGQFEAAAWRAGLDEPVLALACPGPRSVSMLVRRNGAIWRVDRAADDGAVVQEWLLPGVGVPALLGPDGAVVYARDRLLICRTADAVERKAELPGEVLELSELGNRLVSARTAAGAFAVQFLGAEPRLFELPGAGR